MLEIYNEEYKDLLGKTLPAGKKHQVCSTAHVTTETYSEMCCCSCMTDLQTDPDIMEAVEYILL